MRVNYSKLFIINYCFIIILEVLFKCRIMGTNDIGYLYLLIFSLPIAAILTFISSMFKKRNINKVIAIILYTLLFFLFSAESIYFSFYKTICGVEALVYGGQVMEFYEAILDHIKLNLLTLIFYFLPYLFFMLISIKNIIGFEQVKLKQGLALIIATFVFMFSSLQLNIENNLLKKLYFNTNDILKSTNYMGLMPSVSLNAVKILFKFEDKIDVIIPDVPGLEEPEEPTPEEIVYGENVTEIDFDALINSEKDKTVKNMHQYFKNQVITNKNEYTGLFKDKNLIYITAEGFSPIAVNEEVTPTLYKLANNGFVFNNFYQPIYNCSTSDGEFVNLLSILPGVATCSMVNTGKVSFPYSLGKIMKKYDYNTYAIHGWTYTYYNRDETYPNLGFTYYGYDRFKTGYKYALKDIKYSWPTSDIDVMNSSYPIYSGDDKFVTYMMSISGHLQYNFTGGNAISSKNKNVVKDMEASTAIKAYVASQVELDKSLEILLNNLERDGILDDTVIVVSADHYPYGLTNKQIMEYDKSVKETNFDLYKNTLIVYNSTIEEPIIVDKNVGSIDILPTLLNLFDVEYDSRLLIGKDIFSNANDLVIFNNKSWISDKGKYNSVKKKFTPFEGVEVDDNYVTSMNEIVNLKFQMSKLLISKDYYRKVFGEK